MKRDCVMKKFIIILICVILALCFWDYIFIKIPLNFEQAILYSLPDYEDKETHYSDGFLYIATFSNQKVLFFQARQYHMKPYFLALRLSAHHHQPQAIQVAWHSDYRSHCHYSQCTTIIALSYQQSC